MSKFTFKKLEGTNFKNSTRENYQIGLTDQTAFLTPEDVKYLVDGLTKKAPKGTRFVDHGLGIAGVHELGESSKYQHRQIKNMRTNYKDYDI